MMPYRGRANGISVQSGMKALFFGDSIADPYYYGQWCDTLCTQTGLVKLNGNLVVNGNFETDVSGWVTPNSWATLTKSATQFKYGANSMRVQPTAAGQTNNWAIATPENDGGSPLDGGNPNGSRRMGMQLGRTYTFSAWVYVPTGNLGSMFLSIYDNDGTGAASTNSATATANSTWQQLSVTRTLRAYSGSGTPEAYCRAQWVGSAGQVDSTKFFYLDGAVLESGSWSGSQVPIWGTNRGTTTSPAVAGSLLVANGSDPNTAYCGTTAFATRCGNFAPDIVFVHYGINDWYNANGYGITAANWRTGVKTCLANIAAMSPRPQAVWLGLSTTTTTAPSVPGSGWTGYDTSSITNFKYAMDLIAREECADARVPFIGIAPLMATSLVQANRAATISPYTVATADGIHPTQTGGADGQTFIAQRVMSALGVM